MSEHGRSLCDFPPVTREQWQSAVEEGRGGVALESLQRRTDSGFCVAPIYLAEDAPRRPSSQDIAGGQAPDGGWRLAQEYVYPDPTGLARAIALDQKHGLEQVWISLDGSIRRGADPGEVGTLRCGAMIATVSAFRAAMDPIRLETTPLFVDAGAAGLPAFATFIALARDRGVDIARLSGGILADPITVLAETGSIAIPLERAIAAVADVTTWAQTHAPGMATLGVSANVWHDAGASAALELGCALATGIEYLRVLDRHGLNVDTVAPKMVFRWAAGADLFEEIAKLRAARRLWAGVLAAYGVKPDQRRMRLHVRTSWRSFARTDPWTNLLRGTGEAFSAVCGGAESVVVAPFDEPLGMPGDLGRRMALNTQLVLRHECDLARVADPGAGSWYLESLTEDLARRAWDVVRQLEAEGGMIAALRRGGIQERVHATAVERAHRVAEGRMAIVGVTIHRPDDVPPTGAKACSRSDIVRDAIRRREGEVVENYVDELEQLTEAIGDSRDARIEAAIKAVHRGASFGEILASYTDGGARILVRAVGASRLSDAFELGGEQEVMR